MYVSEGMHYSWGKWNSQCTCVIHQNVKLMMAGSKMGDITMIDTCIIITEALALLTCTISNYMYL